MTVGTSLMYTVSYAGIGTVRCRLRERLHCAIQHGPTRIILHVYKYVDQFQLRPFDNWRKQIIKKFDNYTPVFRIRIRYVFWILLKVLINLIIKITRTSWRRIFWKW